MEARWPWGRDRRTRYLPIRFFMIDHAVASGAFLRRNLPSGSGGAYQHGPGSGARPAQRIPRGANAHAAAGGLVAVIRHIPISLHHRDARPIRIELFSEDHYQRRAHALAHLGARSYQANCTGRSDLDEGIWGKGVSRGGGHTRRWPVKGQQQTGACRRSDLRKSRREVCNEFSSAAGRSAFSIGRGPVLIAHLSPPLREILPPALHSQQVLRRPDAPRRECADRCRSGRYDRRAHRQCRHRLAKDFWRAGRKRS